MRVGDLVRFAGDVEPTPPRRAIGIVARLDVHESIRIVEVLWDSGTL